VTPTKLNNARTVSAIVNADIDNAAAIAGSKLEDGAITNAKVNASAAIADSKLATIATAGKVSNSATTATSANTASAIVARDASGNFTAGTIAANLSGNATSATTATTATTATSATTLATGRTISLTGDVTATTGSFNGSANVSATATIGSNAVTTAKIADANVTTAKIADANVTNAKLASGIDAAKLTTGTLPIARVADGAIAAAKLDGAQSGSAPIFGCRAWVNFDGTKDTTGTVSTANTNRLIRASGNVASVLRNATGNYTVTFTTAMPDANYAVVQGGSLSSTSVNLYAPRTDTLAAGSFRYLTATAGASALADYDNVFAVVVR
jgi:hypothetical protein